MAAVHIFDRTLPILYLWQDIAKFVILAAVHEFGRSNAKINTHMFHNFYLSLSLPLFYLLGIDTYLKIGLNSLNLIM